MELLKEISDALGQYCYEGSVDTTEVLLDSDGEYAYVPEDVTVTSVKLNALSATITYEFTGLYPAFEWDGSHVYAVMKDGTEIMLEDNWSRWDGYNVLKARSPIIMDELDHIRLADGTIISMAQ